MFSKIATLSTVNVARIQSVAFAIIGVLGIAIVDRIAIDMFAQSHPTYFDIPFIIGVLFYLMSAAFLYLLLRNTARVAQEARAQLYEHQQKERDALMLFNVALDMSADAIYWFSFDTKFGYVNDAACQMLGYSKEELLELTIEDIDKNESQNSANFLEYIKQRKFVRFETTQTRKDGSVFAAAISANYVSNGESEYICVFGRDISAQKAHNDALQKALHEKEVLIKEVHHRVKNNLEIISSLLQMQNRREDNDAVKAALTVSQNRIHAIAMVHEMLYKTSELDHIDMRMYVERLVDIMIELYGVDAQIVVHIDVGAVYLNMDHAVLCGLIIHELFLNSLKHSGKAGEIAIFFAHDRPGHVRFGLRDNGKGFDPDAIDTDKSLGWQLITTIVENQLDGETSLQTRDGFTCTIVFPVGSQSSEK